MNEYARRGIQQYIVIDRGRRRGDQKRVIVGKLHRGTYRKRYYTGGDTLNCEFFHGYSAADLYIPQDIQAKERREKDLQKSLKETVNRERSEKRRISIDSERHRKESERHRKESERRRKESENYRKKNEELRQELTRITGQKRKDSGSSCVLNGNFPSTSCKRNRKL
ncbi:hypothetical protein BWQ96_07530 [Gracilariopsis chorda]|uniref:Uncharacterized protein n=1 Tax=Gracilariopsis chorda TaxID=448386 RepID=A0A2V3IKU8_9FLOR|nr:hypothetical protein BWQ96_07530 [Gracilariopsis chorda]|eukprot:PXF42715.1 hypothetical protein BWQ96_07530 [Gracilariopsis chorda]